MCTNTLHNLHKLLFSFFKKIMMNLHCKFLPSRYTVLKILNFLYLLNCSLSSVLYFAKDELFNTNFRFSSLTVWQCLPYLKLKPPLAAGEPVGCLLKIIISKERSVFGVLEFHRHFCKN